MKKLALPCISLILLNIVDFNVTQWQTRHGVIELNPLIDLYVGTIWHPLIKVGGIILITLILAWCYKKGHTRLVLVELYSMTILSGMVVAYQLYNRYLGANLGW